MTYVFQQPEMSYSYIKNGCSQRPHVLYVRMCLNSNTLLCMKVGTGGGLALSREYPKQLFGPMFYSWWNCPLKQVPVNWMR